MSSHAKASGERNVNNVFSVIVDTLCLVTMFPFQGVLVFEINIHRISSRSKTITYICILLCGHKAIGSHLLADWTFFQILSRIFTNFEDIALLKNLSPQKSHKSSQSLQRANIFQLAQEAFHPLRSVGETADVIILSTTIFLDGI